MKRSGVITLIFLLLAGCFFYKTKSKSATIWLSETFVAAVPDFLFTQEEEKRVNIFLNSLFSLQEEGSSLKKKYNIYLFPSLLRGGEADKIIKTIESFLDLRVEEKDWIKKKVKENEVIGHIFNRESSEGLIFSIPDDKSSEKIREAASAIYKELTDAEKDKINL